MTDFAPKEALRIAVIVPNYNDSRFISRCLRSILDQEDMPDELIVVDDHSTDDSVALIRSLTDGREGVIVIENPVNLGTYGAVDAGLRQSRSEYVLFLSANDFVLPGIFAHARKCLSRHSGVGLWSAMGWIVDEDDRPVRLQSLAVPAFSDRFFLSAECREMAWRLGSWFTGTTVIYHRATLELVGRFDPVYRGLSDLVTALAVAGKSGAVFSPTPFAVVRQHAGSYLSNTLGDPAVLSNILCHFRESARIVAPELFNGAFLERTVNRFVFAAIRASGGVRIGEFRHLGAGQSPRMLGLVDSLVPRSFRVLRVALAFLILRAFDIVPTIWNRTLGTLIVAMRGKPAAVL
jgi:hypothetical protein